MQILTKQEGDSWIKKHLGDVLWKSNLKELYAIHIDYLLIPDSGEKISLARNVVNGLQLKTEACFVIDEHGVWPSSENPYLFYQYRKALNEKRTILEAPYHIFDNSDMKDIECLLDFALLFFWDSYIVEPNLKYVIKTSHDEYLAIYAEDKRIFDHFKEIIDKYELKVLGKNE